jgi:hypothetical protein
VSHDGAICPGRPRCPTCSTPLRLTPVYDTVGELAFVDEWRCRVCTLLAADREEPPMVGHVARRSWTMGCSSPGAAWTLVVGGSAYLSADWLPEGCVDTARAAWEGPRPTREPGLGEAFCGADPHAGEQP